MSDFDKVLELTSDARVELGASFKKLLHSKLTLGQTRYACRYGTLSDGHEKITPAQRYFQAIREMYVISNSVLEQKARAMEFQADLLDAQELLDKSTKVSEKIRAEAKILRAQTGLTAALVTVEDQLRQVDEFNRVRLELEPEVEAKYPGGIEEAELDSWRAVAEYRLMREKTLGLAKERMDNIPLPMEYKAAMGIAYDRPDMIAPLMVAKQDEIKQLPSQSINEYLGLENRSDS